MVLYGDVWYLGMFENIIQIIELNNCQNI